MQASPLYCVGEWVRCRSHLLGSWRAQVVQRSPAERLPTVSYTDCWCYSVAVPVRPGGMACGCVWLPEECLAGRDEGGF